MPGIDTIRQALGPTNGANTTFQTPTDFVAGTLQVWEDGHLLTASDDNGFLEGAPPHFTLKQPPRAGASVACAYQEA